MNDQSLRPYQSEIARAVLSSVYEKKGLTFTVEIARQGGKNELSARLERRLLTQHFAESKNLIKCSPTFKPQAFISMLRLKEKLNESAFSDSWTSEMNYIIRVGDARAIFLSADTGANVVGNTAHLLLEVDEAQDVSEDKYTKEFRPMGSTSNVTNVLYGTTWDDRTLLEKMKQTNLELERKDGIRRHFRFDWQEVGKYNPLYLTSVQIEMDRLGPNHPLFLTQYCLLPIHGGGGFLNSQQRDQLKGDHSRLSHPQEHIVINTGNSQTPRLAEPRMSRPRSPSPIPILDAANRIAGTLQGAESVGNPGVAILSKIYVAGIDLAGESETGENDFLKFLKPRQDSTVITIAEVMFDSRFKIDESQPNPLINPESTPLRPFINQSPTIKVVQHYVWTGIKHPDLYRQMVDLLKNVWHCRRIVVDATGLGQPVASFLREALGSRVIPFTFTAPAKSELGFNLLAAVNAGKLKMYAADNSPEYSEFWFEMEKARGFYRPGRTMNFYVDPSEGHDDFLMSLALTVEAASRYSHRSATGSASSSLFSP